MVAGRQEQDCYHDQNVVQASGGVEESTNTERLIELGVCNTVDELIEAQLAAQREILSGTTTGRAIVQTLGNGYLVTGLLGHLVHDLSDKVRENIRVSPIPTNAHPEHNRKWRRARAKYRTEQYSGDPRTRYVDAAD